MKDQELEERPSGKRQIEENRMLNIASKKKHQYTGRRNVEWRDQDQRKKSKHIDHDWGDDEVTVKDCWERMKIFEEDPWLEGIWATSERD